MFLNPAELKVAEALCKLIWVAAKPFSTAVSVLESIHLERVYCYYDRLF